MFFGRIIRD
jgi:hypothetical protein